MTNPSTLIREVRERVAATMADGPWVVHTVKPDDLSAPCLVVDRPSVTLDVQHHTFNVAVIAVGRRDGSDDAQLELDEMASWAMDAIAGPDFAVLRVDPGTASIADLTYPAYDLTVACAVTYCTRE